MVVTRLSDFPNLLHDDIDLSAYAEPGSKHRVRPADYYMDGVIRHLCGEGIPTGRAMPYPSLNGKFELRDSEMTVWTGFKGHGKSSLISQVLMHCMEYNEPVFQISPEFTAVQLLIRMIYQRLRTREPGAAQLREWFDWATKRLWIYDQQASVKADDVPALCRYVCDEFGIKHILIDSLMKMGIAPDDFNRQKRFVDDVQNVSHNNPVHIHLVAHARKAKDDSAIPSIHDIKGGSEIADMVENVLVVWRNKPKENAQSLNEFAKENDPDAMLKVEAQRNAEGWIGTIPLMYDRRSMLFYEAGFAPQASDYVKF